MICQPSIRESKYDKHQPHPHAEWGFVFIEMRVIIMARKCENPYCDFPEPEMRLPKDQELEFWKNEADDKDLDYSTKERCVLKYVTLVAPG